MILLALTGAQAAVALTVTHLTLVAVVLLGAGATIAPVYATIYSIVERVRRAGLAAAAATAVNSCWLGS